MDKQGIKSAIKWFSIVWGVVALTLFILAVRRIMTLETFQSIFLGGFVLWVIVVSVLSKMLLDNTGE